MNLFGYSDDGVGAEQGGPVALAEVTLCASADEVRTMASFLMSCAAEMDRIGCAYDHVHLSDRLKKFEDWPRFVIAGQARL
ncbi:MAG: hypothetical protein EOO80_03750 [Oxalobacteraceae bacterium]|nr:MAG: hypothetical protein EOO80_03750 [Oxalobacteraceae bacterium]